MEIYYFFFKSSKSLFLNNSPNLPFCNISLGPVGQLDEMINFFNDIASNKTFGNPS